MRLPLSWLKEFVPVRLAPEVLAKQLSQAGINVERIERTNIPETVVVGEVVSVDSHPNADRLLIAMVNLGEKTPRQIVCGAPNLAPKQRVAVALPGTILPNGTTISSATIRGVASSGMICAEDELGVGEDHTGILVLPNDARIGKPAALAIGADDIVFELEITPNRSDCLSIFGCAREAAALTGSQSKIPKLARGDGGALNRRALSVTVADKKDCPLYTARLIENVKIGPSPRSIQKRLTTAGVRPLNNVIDVTNYVMLELGQPLHAFDVTAIPDRRIFVRRARAGESLCALDGKTYTLTPDMLVIASTAGPIALAGIMGGEESGISSGTTTVILESAVFDPVLIRKTSKKLGCASESSYRFERQVNARATSDALDYAATLLATVSGGSVAQGRVVVGSLPKPPKPVTLSVDRTNAMLSLSLTPSAMTRLLKLDGARVVGTGKKLRVTPPDWRPDLMIEEDLIEEVGRLYGYPRLPLTLVSGTLAPVALPPMWQMKEDCTNALFALGGTESKTYPYYSRKTAEDFHLSLEHHVRILNPLSQEQELLRTAILPVFVRKTGLASREENMLFLYEIGRCFRESSAPLPTEQERLAIVIVQPDSYRVLKGILSALLGMLGVPHDALAWTIAEGQYGSGETLAVHGEPAGQCSRLSTDLCTRFKYRGDVAVAELALDPVLSARTKLVYASPSAFPTVRRDLAFWVPESVRYDAVAACVRGIDPLLVDFDPFDVYAASERRSIALHLTFQSPDRTLTSTEVEKILERLRAKLTSALHAEIRIS